MAYTQWMLDLGHVLATESKTRRRKKIELKSDCLRSFEPLTPRQLY